MNVSVVLVDTETPVLVQSGKLGAVIKVQTEVEPWVDANGGNPYEVPVNSGNPFEF